MNRTQKWASIAVASIAVVSLIAACAASSSCTPDTPLHTMRMEQVCDKMNFLPAAMNEFVYTTGKGKAQDVEDKRVYGIDISDYQNVNTRTIAGKAIDWNQVRNDAIQFVFIKATEGATHKDPYFKDNISGAKYAKLIVGVYHLARPDIDTSNNPVIGKDALVDDAKGEADFFVEITKSCISDGYLVPALDVEPEKVRDLTKENLSLWVDAFMTRFEERTHFEEKTGLKPLIYTNKDTVLEKQKLDDNLLKEYALWIAWHNCSLERPLKFPEEYTLAFLQYNDEGSVPGIEGNVDLNVYFGSIDDLRQHYVIGGKSQGNPSNEIGDKATSLGKCSGNSTIDTCDPTCWDTCEFTCWDTCYTCWNTCGETCWNTCEVTCETICGETYLITCWITCDNTCEFTCEDTCGETCFDTCWITCDNTCEFTCEDTCGETCFDTCWITCDNTCQDTCEVTCWDTCEETCFDTCWITCLPTCQDTCEVTCWNTCEVTCWNTCGETCLATCNDTCFTCGNNTCAATCWDTCRETCWNTCPNTCAATCQDTCEVTCWDTCYDTCFFTCEASCGGICGTKQPLHQITCPNTDPDRCESTYSNTHQDMCYNACPTLYRTFLKGPSYSHTRFNTHNTTSSGEIIGHQRTIDKWWALFGILYLLCTLYKKH